MESVCKICQHVLRLYLQDLFDDRYGYPGSFSVYRCDQCGFAQLSPAIPPAELENLYTQYYPRKDISVASIEASVIRHEDWLRGNPSIYLQFAQPNSKVLDIGCGDGSSLLTIQSCGAEAYGTEFDHNVIAPAEQLGLNIHIGDLNTIPQPDEWFDVITMNQLLEHVTDPQAFLRQVKKKLKPGGQIVVTTPQFGSLPQRCSGRRWVNWHIPFHLNFFNKHSIKRLVQQSGLTVERIRTFTPMAWVMLQTINLLRPKLPVGTPNLFWKPKPAELTKFQYMKQLGVRAGMILIVAHAMGWLTLPVYRLIDGLGFGDSFIIVLKKPNAR